MEISLAVFDSKSSLAVDFDTDEAQELPFTRRENFGFEKMNEAVSRVHEP